MSPTSPTLHLVCGKIASGKSTLTAKLASMDSTIVIVEDDWLAALYSDEMTSISDYARCSAKLQYAMGPHVAALLNTGMSVVLDFPAITIAQRSWMWGIIQETGVAHKLHYLNATDKVCIARLRARNAIGNHPFTASDEQFAQFSKYFIVPTPAEGFDIVEHPQNDI